jgi:SAM-dependent methyltransferase
VIVPATDDAWGRALLDQFHGRAVPQPQLEVDGGESGPAMHPEWFFRTFDQWDWWDRELLPLVETGPVLDLGAGAGRASLYLQERGLAVTAVDSSPGAVEVCRLRGVRDARLADLNAPPTDRRWAAVLLLCGNLGLGGDWDGCRALLARLARSCVAGARLIGDSVEPGTTPDVRLRIRYRGAATPWWRQRNIGREEVPALVEDTGWVVERQLHDGADHAVVLRSTSHPLSAGYPLRDAQSSHPLSAAPPPGRSVLDERLG